MEFKLRMPSYSTALFPMMKGMKGERLIYYYAIESKLIHFVCQEEEKNQKRAAYKVTENDDAKR